MTISAIVVDDEKNGRENLSGLIKNYCPQINILGEANSVAQAIIEIQFNKPQLIFLNIEMPGGNGFELLKHFEDFLFEVIFVTA
jgi:two-component system LytT family response regulator